MIQRFGIDPADGFLLADQALPGHIHGDLDGCGCGPLARPRLEHVKPTLLDGELEVLHVAVVVFEFLADGDQLPVALAVVSGELRYRLGRSDARDNVLALGVHKEFAVENVPPRCCVAREGHARPAVAAHVAKDHRLDIDSRAEQPANVIYPAIRNRPGIVPRAEDRVDGGLELLASVLRETLAGLPVNLHVFTDDFLQACCVQVGVQLGLAAPLYSGQGVLEVVVLHPENHVAEHLHQSAVCVPYEPLVAGQLDQGRQCLVVQTEVQHGVHHARHGDRRTAAHRDQQRISPPSERLAGVLLKLSDVGVDLPGQAGGIFAPALVIQVAYFGGNGEPGRDGQAQ